MRLIKAALIGFLLAVAAPLSAFAQCSGQAPASTYCGNPTGSTALPGWRPMGGFVIDLDVGSTTITGGVTGRLLYDNGGVLGEYTTVPLAFGGLAASLVASNGGIFYSTASAGAILSGTATAGQMLQSGASSAPAWSTTTWPTTSTINQLLYSSATNAVAGLPTANNSVLVTNGSGVPSFSTTLPSGLSNPLDDGKVFVGNVSNVAVGVTPSGDCTISNTGVLTCTKFTSSSVARVGLGLLGFGATTLVTAPDGVNVRQAVSDTSAQMHYDNISLGKDQYGGSGSVGPGITWKAPCLMCNGTLVAGSGGTPGTYTNVPLTGGTGTGATASITVGGGGTVTAVWVGSNGDGAYAGGDVLSASSGDIGGATGFTYTLTALGSDASIINIGGVVSQANPSGGATLTMGGNFNHGVPFKIYTDTCGNPQLAGVACSSNNSRFTVLGVVPDQNSFVGVGLDTPTSGYAGTVLHVHSGVTANAAMIHFTTLDKGGAVPPGSIGSYVGYGTNGDFYIQTLDNLSNIVTQSNGLTVAQIIGNTGFGCAVGPCPMFYYAPVVSLSPGANTAANGVVLLNNNAATAGNQQYSPGLTLTGQGWKTDATAGSQAVDWRMFNIPVQGTASPSSVLTFSRQINGGGYTPQFSMSSDGVFSAATGYQVNGAATSGNYLRGNGTNFVSSAIQSSDIRTAGGVVALGQSNIPFVLVSSGTMGNNGALSGVTALPTTYASAYVYLPANAISAGSSAGWYYAVFSSTTAATVYNNTYTSGTPTIPGSPTAFVTTGPGAYTQTTGSYISAYTVSVPANSMGTNGAVRLEGLLGYNNTAGSKAARLLFGGSYVSSVAGTTTTNTAFFGGVANRGVANSQVQISSGGMQYTGTTTGLTYLTKDTTSAQDMVVQMQLVSAATDTLVLEKTNVTLIPGT